jgi:N-acetylglutamate synthase-like GNAT family acetyltransferase
MIRSPQTKTEWTAYYQLRYTILRAPWGQAKGSEQTPDEDQHQHFAYFDTTNQLLGVGRLDLLDPQTTQVRFMAVADEQQGKGIGKAIMEEMESVSKEMGIQKIILHAREVALPFYQQLGYQLDAPSHLLFGEIQHFLMHKLI